MLSRLFLLLCACHSSGNWTKGQKGVASFAYRASPGCEDGCDLERNHSDDAKKGGNILLKNGEVRTDHMGIWSTAIRSGKCRP